MVKRTRPKKKVNYTALNEGLSSPSQVSTSSDVSSPNKKTPPRASSPPLAESDGEGEIDLDAEILRLEAVKQALVDKQHRDAKEKRLKELVRDIELLKAKEATQPSEPAVALQSPRHVCSASSLPATSLPVNDISIKDLRNVCELNDQAEAHLARYGLTYPEQQATRQAEPYSHQLAGKDTFNSGIPNVIVTKNLVSGKESRAKDCVVAPVIWPHTKLEYSFTAIDVNYDKLDLALLGAGEVSVIISSNPIEQLGRLTLLRRVLYHSKDYQWPAVRNFHQSVLLEIERGVRTWQNTNYLDIEASVLFKNPITPSSTYIKSSGSSHQGNSRIQTSRRYFCLDFNRSVCAHEGSHEARIGTVNQEVEHFCAACWRKERIAREHKETSSTCPNKR